MPNYNQITLMGHAGRDAELRTTQGGTSVANFSLAVKDTYKDETVWFECSAFGKTAENYVSKYLTKGSIVMLTGSVSLEVFEKRDGTPGGSMKVLVKDIQIVNDHGSSERQETTQTDNMVGMSENVDELEDEIPF